MSVIACLRIPPTPAVCDLCAELTPVVEPAADCVWMDWTGGPPVPVLAARLAEALAALPDCLLPDCLLPDRPQLALYRLGVAPRRFAAGALASQTFDAARTGLPVQPVPGGYWVRTEALPAFASRLPIAFLTELDPSVRGALEALGVGTLGDLLSSPRELLQAHIGAETGRLLDWARGRDPRPVRALYPPERLVHRVPAEALASTDAERLETVIGQATAALAERLHTTGQACARLAVVWGGKRHERCFTPPVADAGQLARAAAQAAKQLLLEWAHDKSGRAPSSEISGNPEIPGDCVLEISPTAYAGRQTLLWDPDRPDGPRHHPALAAICARFGHTFLRPARPAGPHPRPGFLAAHGREAVARYEAMNRFYWLAE